MARVLRAMLALLVVSLAPGTVRAQQVDSSATAVLTAPSATPPVAARISTSDPMNGGFLIVNQHGMLFHDLDEDAAEDINYARWLGAGIIRVFGTDNNGFKALDGKQVGNRIADRAPMLRAANMKLIVAFVNNHRAVPGEPAEDSGWMDNYMQLLLPFYTGNWRGPYLQFVRDLITTVQARGALDVVYAWELGNELHTPRDPSALMPFIMAAVQEVRALDQKTPILPGTMGANHVEPGNRTSPIARWLYCEAPVDAYTLHAYDWISRDRGGDMPIDWDLDNIVSQPCANGRQLPVIVEELGTSRALTGVYGGGDENARLAQERRQIDFVRQFPSVVGFGVWNGESPRLIDHTFIDTRRGLTSYGANAIGGGSCYDPTPEAQTGARCMLENLLRGMRFVRPLRGDWQPATSVDVSTDALVGGLSITPDGQNVAGWVLDTQADGSTGVTGVDVYAGDTLVTRAQMGISRPDVAMTSQKPEWAAPGFSAPLPLSALPNGSSLVTLAAHTTDGSTWLSGVQVVQPVLGSAVPPRRVVTQVVAVPRPVSEPPRLDVAAPARGASVGRSFLVQGVSYDVHATSGAGVDRVDVFLEPDRDAGGPIVGSGAPGDATLSARLGRALGPNEFVAYATVPRGEHTLYVHAHSAVTGQEIVISVPVVVS
jgi:hypothetical protein